MTQTVTRVLGWLAVSTIIVLWLLPATERPHTGASGHSEHISAYLITAILLGLGYPSRKSSVAIVIGLSTLAALMELCQIFITGRHPGLDDFLVSGLGALVGMSLVWTRGVRRTVAQS